MHAMRSRAATLFPLGPGRAARTPSLRTLVPWVLAVGLLALGLSGCGHRHRHHHDDRGHVFLDNLTDTTTMEDVDAFRLAAFGDPFTGNLLSTPLPPGFTRFIGTFHEDFYDAEADLEFGDLVEWFDVFVGNGDDAFFEVF